MKIIGLTGPTGAGKGVAAACFAELGIPCVDTDRVYHELLLEKGPCTAELVGAFGNAILNEHGLVDRRALADAVFGREDTPARLATLNAVTHKYIMAETWRRVQQYREKSVPAVLIDAPQLFEAGVDKDCDLVLGILARPSTRLSRVLARDEIGEDAARRRIAAQHDEAFFRAKCDRVIDNDGTVEELRDAVRRFVKAEGLAADA